ncbi:GFA family protein [Planktotalea sp.]|uniref:GFA family protein n=1 Tax=Planktotalea sp. TaxID=2029877 RepID=UPI003296BA9A
MTQHGGCYCGELRYELTADPVLKGQCHCRECQHIAGGAPQYYMAIPQHGLRYTQGGPKAFRRTDLDDPVSREFCATCGTHILTRRADFDGVILKVGTLDTPATFKAPSIAIFVKDAQAFHHIPEGLPQFDGLPNF